MNEDWLKDIHDRMADFEMEEPAGLWEELHLNDNKVQAPKQKQTIWLLPRRLAAVAVVLVGMFAGYHFLTDISIYNKVEKTDGVAKTTAGSTPKGADAVEQQLKTSLADRLVAKATGIGMDGMMQTVMPDVTDSTEVEVAQHQETTVVAESHDDADNNSNNAEGDRKEPKRNRDTYNTDRQIAYNDHLYARAGVETSSRVTVGLYTSGATSYNHSATSDGVSDIPVSGPQGADWADDALLGILLYNQGKDIDMKVKHHLPLTTGVSMGYQLNDRLSVETGVVYTLLASDFSDGSHSNHITGNQRLHYVGVPLSMKYNVIPRKRFTVYTSAGMTIAKCVSGSIDRSYVVGHRSSEKKEKETVDEKPMQVSLKAGVGLQYNISDVFGVYAEPGLAYHFADNSSLNTIYKDKPLNLNINIGLRLTFGKKSIPR